MQWDDRIRSIAQTHGFEPDAAETMARAIQRAGGGVAEWDHPPLGGAGEWIPGTTVLSPRQPATEKRLDNLCLELLGLLKETGHATQPGVDADLWWPRSLGLRPNVIGDERGVRYACFAASRRLAVDRGDGHGVIVHDTGEHEIRGLAAESQSPPVPGDLIFESQLGEVALRELKVIPTPPTE